MNENILAKIADFIKDLLTPKKNVGDSTSYMSGKRGADLMSGKSTPSGWYEAFMLEKYVKDTTPVGDPRRVQFSAENNLKRIVNYSALIVVIAVLVIGYLYGVPYYYRYKHRIEMMDAMPRVEASPMGRISTPQYIRTSTDEFGEPIANIISILPKGYDPKTYPRDQYRIFEGAKLIDERYKHPKPHKLIMELVPGGCNLLDPDDLENIEYMYWMYENKKYYIFNGRDSVWTRAYTVPELDRIGFNPEFAVVAKNTNIIVRFE